MVWEVYRLGVGNPRGGGQGNGSGDEDPGRVIIIIIIMVVNDNVNRKYGSEFILVNPRNIIVFTSPGII